MIAVIIVTIFSLFFFHTKPRSEPKLTTITIPTDQVQNLEGKRIYVSNCVRCHNSNPHKPGIIGPELYTTPLEVFRTKVPTGTYPPDYKPKRKTKVMPKFKHLTDKVDSVYNYIRSIPK